MSFGMGLHILKMKNKVLKALQLKYSVLKRDTYVSVMIKNPVFKMILLRKETKASLCLLLARLLTLLL